MGAHASIMNLAKDGNAPPQVEGIETIETIVGKRAGMENRTKEGFGGGAEERAAADRDGARIRGERRG